RPVITFRSGPTNRTRSDGIWTSSMTWSNRSFTVCSDRRSSTGGFKSFKSSSAELPSPRAGESAFRYRTIPALSLSCSVASNITTVRISVGTRLNSRKATMSFVWNDHFMGGLAARACSDDRISGLDRHRRVQIRGAGLEDDGGKIQDQADRAI